MYNILIRVDSGHIIGTGHVQRCLNLVNQFDNANIYFLCKEFSGNLISNITQKYKVITLQNDVNSDIYIKMEDRNTWLGEDWINDAEKTLKEIKKFNFIDLFIIDHYGVNEEWEKYIYHHVNNLFIIDDVYRNHYCHILQNQHVNHKYKDINDDCIQLIGSDYAILNKDIANLIPKKNNS